MKNLFEPLRFKCGKRMKNRFMLAPLTNLQSHEDGSLSDDEYRWLTMRAEGGFGLTMTCAASIQAAGRGFPGQLGCFADEHVEGLARLAAGIREHESLAMLQLHHAGMRSPQDLVGTQPLCPSAHEETGARALTVAEVEQVAEDFILAARRAEEAGFDGVELHCAHGYLLCQFLSPTINCRTDRYGGSAENRARIIFDIVDGIRGRCRPGFLLGVRLSPERFGLRFAEIRDVAERLLREEKIDLLDLSLWDAFKEPQEEEYRGRTLLSYFTELNRREVRIGAAGKLFTPEDVLQSREAGTDIVILGRAAILHHDFPERLRSDADFGPVRPPVSADYLRAEGLGEAFIDYMRTWKGFVEA